MKAEKQKKFEQWEEERKVNGYSKMRDKKKKPRDLDLGYIHHHELESTYMQTFSENNQESPVKVPLFK